MHLSRTFPDICCYKVVSFNWRWNIFLFDYKKHNLQGFESILQKLVNYFDYLIILTIFKNKYPNF